MSDVLTSADALAYADSCLDPARRPAMEARLSEDAVLRRRVEMWRAHNDSIRAAFGAPETTRAPLLAGRPSNENKAPRTGDPLAGRRANAPAGRADPARPAASPARTSARRRLSGGRRFGLTLAMAALAVVLLGSGGPSDPRPALLQDASTAFRAFGAADFDRLDIVTDNPRDLVAQLGPFYVRSGVERYLAVDGWKLLGARFAPGVHQPAVLALFEDAKGDRAGFWMEPLDANPDAGILEAVVKGAKVSAWVDDNMGVASVGAASYVAEAAFARDMAR